MNHHSAAIEEGFVESMSPSSQPIISCLDYCSSPPWSPFCCQFPSASSTCDLNGLLKADLGCCHSLAPSPRLSSTQGTKPKPYMMHPPLSGTASCLCLSSPDHTRACPPYDPGSPGQSSSQNLPGPFTPLCPSTCCAFCPECLSRPSHLVGAC